MTQALRPDTRAVIKRESVDLFFNLLEPFHDPDLNLFAGSDEPAEVQYDVLTPKYQASGWHLPTYKLQVTNYELRNSLLVGKPAVPPS